MDAREAATDFPGLRDIGAVLGLSKRAVEQRARRENWPYIEVASNGGKQRRYPPPTLPADVRDALIAARMAAAKKAAADAAAKEAAKSPPRHAAMWQAYERAEPWRKHVAERRQAALMEVARLQEDDGLSLAAARQRVIAGLVTDGTPGGASESALKRWGRIVRGVPHAHWLAYLLPQPKEPRASAWIHPDAWATFKADFLRLERPGAAACYRRLKRQAVVRPEWLPLASRKTFENRISRDVPRPQFVLRRYGEEALMCMGPKIKRDRSDMHAMQAVNADGHTFDVFVKFPDGSIGRPVILGWQDIYSGKLLSYRFATSETADAVRMSFVDLVARYGIPAHAHLDNGRAFAAKGNTGGMATRYRYRVKPDELNGVITRIGTKVHWVTPYNGKAKPVERAWRDFAQEIAKRPEFAGAYTGNRPDAKPENYGSRAIPWGVFCAVVADGIAEWNARDGRRSDVADGRSLNEVFADSYANTTVEKATTEQLRLLLLPSRAVSVDGKTGDVVMAGNRYWSEALCEHMGSTVELRFDPDQLHSIVHAFTLAGGYIGEVPCVVALGHGSTEKVKVEQRKKAAWRRSQKKAVADEKAYEAARAKPFELPPIEGPEPPAPGVIKLHTKNRRPIVGLAEPEVSAQVASIHDAIARAARQRAQDAL